MWTRLRRRVAKTKAATLFQMCRHSMLAIGKHLNRGVGGGKGGGAVQSGYYTITKNLLPYCLRYICPTHIPATDRNMGSDGFQTFFFFFFFYDENELALRQHYEQKSRRAADSKQVQGLFVECA